RFPARGGGTHYPLARADAKVGWQARQLTFGVSGDQRAVGSGDEDVEYLVVENPAYLRGDRRKELLGIQDLVDLPYDGEQLGQQVARQRDAGSTGMGTGHQPRILPGTAGALKCRPLAGPRPGVH